MPNSIFHASMKSFFVTLFAVFGFGFAIIPVVALLSSLSNLEEKTELKTHYTPTVVSNGGFTRSALTAESPVILRINIDGVIGTELLSTKSITDQLVESREGDLKNNRVKGVLLHINSPGGTVTDSDGIYRAIKRYKEEFNVPVFAFVDGLCASGGMYIASAADQVYATEASVIGSVGVMMSPFFNFTELLEKVGVKSKTITAGKEKDEMNPFRPWKEGEAENIQQLTNEMYAQFIGIVTKNRPNLNREKLINEYGAQIFSAKKAEELGFIDASGYDLLKTMNLLAAAMGAQEDKYQVVQMESKYWFSNLFSSESPLFTGRFKHELKLNTDRNLFDR